MKTLLFIFLFSVGWMTLALGADLSPKHGKIVGRCKKSPSSSRHVWIFKQWHLAPGVNSRTSNPPAQPQEANQTAIYLQLEEWIKRGQIQEIFAEGCWEPLLADSRLAINGWSLKELRQASKQSDYSRILSSVPLKLEAKFGDRIQTVCADTEKAIHTGLSALSDARGALGFYSRLKEHKNSPEKAKTYLEGVIELYRLPKTITAEEALPRLKKELETSVDAALTAIETRSKNAAEKIRLSKAKASAVVFGGSHGDSLMNTLEAAGINCTLVEPVGYNNDEAQLLVKLQSAIDSL